MNMYSEGTAELDFDVGLAKQEMSAGRYRNAMKACEVFSGAMVELSYLDGMLQALIDLGYLKPGPNWPGKAPVTVDSNAERDADYVTRAREKYESEGEVEIDEEATISWGDDNGAYVQAWVWVEDVQVECDSCLRICFPKELEITDISVKNGACEDCRKPLDGQFGELD